MKPLSNQNRPNSIELTLHADAIIQIYLVNRQSAVMASVSPPPKEFTDGGVEWTICSDFSTEDAASAFGVESKMFRGTLYQKSEPAVVEVKGKPKSEPTPVKVKSEPKSTVTTSPRGRLPTGKQLSSDGSKYVNIATTAGDVARKKKKETHDWVANGGSIGKGGWVQKQFCIPSNGLTTDTIDNRLTRVSRTRSNTLANKKPGCTGCECGGCTRYKRIKPNIDTIIEFSKRIDQVARSVE